MKKLFYTIISSIFFVASSSTIYGANINVHPLSFSAVKAFQERVQQAALATPVAFIKAHPSLDSYHFQDTSLFKSVGYKKMNQLGKIYADAAFGEGELANHFAISHAGEFYLAYFSYYYLKYINDKIISVFLNDKSAEMDDIRAENAKKIQKEKDYADHVEYMKLAVEIRNEARQRAAKTDKTENKSKTARK